MFARCRTCVFMMLGISLIAPSARAAEVTPLPRAHAHNDYEHQRPLLDALDQGFTSVEADIYLVEGALLVAHNPGDVKLERTLEALYLDPLREQVQRHGGSMYAEAAPFLLLIDFKSEAESTYQALAATLEKYPELFTRWTSQGRIEGPVTVVISGNRPIETLAKQLPRQAGIDGRLADLENEPNAALMPVISDRWGAHFTWRGVGAIPIVERDKLRAIVQKSHDRGQKVRFWATADTPEMWVELHTAGVDLINTDDLIGLAAFLRSRP